MQPTHAPPMTAIPEWQTSPDPVPYPVALEFMEQHVNNIIHAKAHELVWLLEHPPLYTAGTSASPEDLLSPNRFPVYKTGRGGQYTYHGPGQRIAYVMLDLNRRRRDVRLFVNNLEQWIIATLACFNIRGERRPGRVGIWVQHKDMSGRTREDKIAAIGIRLRHWVSFHGISININPQLEHFSGIVPCGVQDHGITSFEDLGIQATVQNIDATLKGHFEEIFPPPSH